MTPRAWPVRLALNELRALAPVWCGIVLVMLVAARSGLRLFDGLEEIVYILGAVALGALSVGHELVNHTAPLMLTQPVPRAGLFAVKQAVLLLLLLGLVALARTLDMTRPFAAGPALLFFPVLGGLFVAPWITMALRSTMAGATFTPPLPGLLMSGTQVMSLLWRGHGVEPATAETVFCWGALGWCALGAVLSWRTFLRLETAGDAPFAGAWPTWRRKRRAAAVSVQTRVHPLWRLALKELRLQHMVLTSSLLYVAGAFTVGLLRARIPGLATMARVLSVFHCGLIAVLCGALASAEERRLGTLAWQTLLPLRSATQGAVKVAVALALAVTLGCALPTAALRLLGQPGLPELLARPSFVAGMVALTVVSFYVSSISTNGLQAAVLSLAVVFAALVPFSLVAETWLLPIAARVASPWSTAAHAAV